MSDEMFMIDTNSSRFFVEQITSDFIHHDLSNRGTFLYNFYINR